MKRHLTLVSPAKTLKRAHNTSVAYISSDCAPKHEHLFYAREQSRKMRDMEWEGKIYPLMSYSAIALRVVAVLVALAVVGWIFL